MSPSDTLRDVMSNIERERDVTAADYGGLLIKLRTAFELWEVNGDPDELLREAAELEEDLTGDWSETTRLAQAMGRPPSRMLS